MVRFDRAMAQSPARSPATRARQRTHDDEISRAMDKAMRARSETYEQFAARFPTATAPGSLPGGGVPPSELRNIMRDADDDELARYAVDRARIDAELARLNGPAIPDPNKTDEEFEAELAQFRAFAEEFGAFTKAFDEDGIPRGDRAAPFARTAGGSADDANARMVAEFKAAVMKGDADYGATGSRDDDLRVRARLEGAHGNNDGDSNPTEPPRSRRSAFAVDRNGALLTVDTASSSTQPFVHPFDPNKPPSDLDTDDVSEGDVPFFLESPKMAKFDNWVPDEESSEEASSEEESEEESEGSKPASSSDDSDDSEYEDDVEAAAMEEEKRLKAEMVPILGGLRGGVEKPRLKGYGSTSLAAPAFADAVASPAAPLRPLTTVTGGYGSGGVSPSAEAAASRTSPFVTVKGDAHEDDDDEEDDEENEGRASSGMLKRARRRLRGPGRWAVDDDAEDAKAKADEKSKPNQKPNPAVNVDLVMFKIKCGKCAATLKIPAGVDVFRCPKCAAKLRVPVASGGAAGGAFAGKPEKEKAKEPPARTSPGRAAKELSEVAKATRDVIDRHRTERAREARREALGESRAELVRHVEFSKSLEDVIDEMCRQVSARTGVAAGA